MTLKTQLTQIIRPALSELPEAMQGVRAEILLLAIGLQESRFLYRKQIKGPARGYWQFERAGVQGVLSHPASDQWALKLCGEYGIKNAEHAHRLLEHNDKLACQFARLLLFTDPRSLPAIGDAESAWDYYIRNWRPGKPHRQTWGAFYQQAVDTVQDV